VQAVTATRLEEAAQQAEAREAVLQVTLSLMTSLADEIRCEAVWSLLRSLTNAVDDGAASYVQLMVKVVVDSTAADKINREGLAAGTNPSVKKL
jgi:hypothetical protein